MRISRIKQLIKLVEESGIDELEVGRLGSKVKIVRQSGSIRPAVEQSFWRPTTEVSPALKAPTEVTEGLFQIKAPMVGTFYRAPSPDAPPYVKMSQEIEKGQVVCIVEAMKLMNEIESEVSGTVVEILVENSQPVEFGQVLFSIKPRG